MLLKARFRAALRNYHQSLRSPSLSGEIDFIDRTVKNTQKWNITAGNQSLKTRAKRIHLTPQARFFRYPLFPSKHTTVEIGDLLLIYKHFLNGILDAYRAIIVQAKYTKGKKRSWKINTDQFYFLTQWPAFRIVRPASKKWHFIKPTTLTWASYGFVGPNATRYPIYYSSTRMLRGKRMVPSTKSFSFAIRSVIGWDSSQSFLMKFVQGLVGENLLLSTKVKALVDDLYVITKLKPDPPGELEWNNENYEENEGFGIVEFTLTSEQESDHH